LVNSTTKGEQHQMGENGTVEQSQRLHITLPDVGNSEQLENFYNTLEAASDVRGVKTLNKHFKLYLRSRELAERHYDRAKKAANVIAGIKTPRQRKYAGVNTLAYRFLDALDTKQLRVQCQVFGLDYDSFESIEEMFDALIAKMTGTTKSEELEAVAEV
jgi:menaquinone-dependent protoporphyrinogen IX oxidase